MHFCLCVPLCSLWSSLFGGTLIFTLIPIGTALQAYLAPLKNSAAARYSSMASGESQIAAALQFVRHAALEEFEFLRTGL